MINEDIEYVVAGDKDQRTLWFIDYNKGIASFRMEKAVEYNGYIEDYLKKQGCKNIHFGEDLTFTKGRRAK